MGVAVEGCLAESVPQRKCVVGAKYVAEAGVVNPWY